MNAEIIAIGSELLTPFRQDTNSLYLTEKLNQLGVEVVLKTIVGDSRERLVSVAQHALLRSDIAIFMGGLGPTEDDLTREAVAEALGVVLYRDEEVLTRLKERFASRGYKMTPNNYKQADVITGAIVLPNPNGTAPGQWTISEEASDSRFTTWPNMLRPTTMRWIWLVPSTICPSFASRYRCSTG